MSADDFRDFANAQVTLEPLTGRDKYGKPTYGAAASYDARVVGKNVLVRDPQGQTVMAGGIVWIFGTPVVGTSDRVTLPSGYSPVIVSVENYPDESGDHHVKLFIEGVRQ